MLDKFLLRLYIWLDDTKRLIVNILSNKRASAQIPKHILDELARCFLPDILAFYETVEGRKEYDEWKLSKRLRTPHSAPKRKIPGRTPISPPRNFASKINNKSEPFTNW